MAERCVDPRSGERVLGLVKDGVFYEVFRSESGEMVLVDSEQDHLPVVCESVKGIRVARVDCGDNCYVFDPRVLRTTLREVLEFARKGVGSFVLDMSRISLVAESHLKALEHVNACLEGRDRRLVVVAASAVVTREILAAVPALESRIFSREEEALACAAG